MAPLFGRLVEQIYHGGGWFSATSHFRMADGKRYYHITIWHECAEGVEDNDYLATLFLTLEDARAHIVEKLPTIQQEYEAEVDRLVPIAMQAIARLDKC